MSIDIPVAAIDTDPVNRTLAGYKEFDVKVLSIMDGTDFDSRMFDQLIEIAMDLSTDAHLVIDNGASSFIPLCSYMLENELIEMLQSNGHTVMMHSIITGGQGMQDTIDGLKSLVTYFPNVSYVVWLNPKDGEIALGDKKSFYEFDIYKEHGSKFDHIIELPTRNQSTFGKDISEHLARRQSFDAAINSSLPIMVRHRLKKYWEDIKALLAKAFAF